MAIESQLEQPLVEKILDELCDGIPTLEPGGLFFLQGSGRLGDPQNPFVALFSCPKCGLNGLITQRQLWAREFMICGGEECSAEWKIDGEIFIIRPPQ